MEGGESRRERGSLPRPTRGEGGRARGRKEPRAPLGGTDGERPGSGAPAWEPRLGGCRGVKTLLASLIAVYFLRKALG